MTIASKAVPSMQTVRIWIWIILVKMSPNQKPKREGIHLKLQKILYKLQVESEHELVRMTVEELTLWILKMREIPSEIKKISKRNKLKKWKLNRSLETLLYSNRTKTYHLILLWWRNKLLSTPVFPRTLSTKKNTISVHFKLYSLIESDVDENSTLDDSRQ